MEFKHKFKSYDAYVAAQIERSHTYDDIRCAVANVDLVFVAMMISGKSGPVNCLDIGCRDAAWFDMAKVEFPFMVCKGVDISPVSVDYAVSKGRDVSVRDVEKGLEGLDTVDLIVSSHSIEHMQDPGKLLKTLYEQSNKGVVLALRIPSGVDKGKGSAHCTGWDEDGVRALLTRSGWFIRYFFSGRGEWMIVATKIPLENGKIVLRGVMQEQPLATKEMEKEYCELMRDPWLAKKIERKERIKDKAFYVDTYLKEISMTGKYVLDIGCGPSEFLEECRYYRCKAVGIEIDKRSLMGDKYLAYSHLSHRRNFVDVRYGDFLDMAAKSLPFPDNYFNVVNSQGALNQIFTKHFKWKTKEGHLGEFMPTPAATKDVMLMLSEINRVTASGGVVFLYPNGMTNNSVWAKSLISIAKRFGMMVMNQYSGVLAVKFKVHK